MTKYLKKVNKDKDVLYKSQKLCPFRDFQKCIGEDCALYSITGFQNEKGNTINYGDCAIFKLPDFIIDLRTAIISNGRRSK